MNLTCPSCATTFVVEAEQLGPGGRQVRCGNCGHGWHQAAENGADEPAPAAADVAPPPEPAAPEPAAPEPIQAPVVAEPQGTPEKRVRRRGPRPPRQTEARGGGSSLLLGWLLFLVVIAGLGAGLYFGRAQVLALVPAAAPLYRMAGLAPPAGVPLELRDVKTARRVVDGTQVVAVEGLVSNMTSEPQAIPMLRASLIDSKGDEVESWTFAASATTLPPGGTTNFETTTKNPPREGRILIDFVVTP